jgi:hypothetical protein
VRRATMNLLIEAYDKCEFRCNAVVPLRQVHKPAPPERWANLRPGRDRANAFQKAEGSYGFWR